MAAASHPPIMRTASAEHISIAHPTPDLLALQAFQAKNVSRLEKSAEELSQGGSDIGDEIRKMQQEQRASESRRSSIASHDSRAREVEALTSRKASTSSYGNSIVDVNREARWGGYSPAAYITSPAMSLQSGSWTHLQRVASTHSSMRPEPVQEGRPLDSPLASLPSHMSLRRPSQSSLAHSYRPDDDNELPHEVQDEEQEQEEPQTVEHEEDSIYRPATPPSNRPQSSDTFRQARSLFHDFDGVHFSPTHEEFVEFDDEGKEARRIPVAEVGDYDFAAQQHLERTPRARPVSYAEPLPGESMVYYPAPVPRMLNLPKRLSQMPSALYAQRRSQVMSQVPQEVRHSSAWLPALDFQEEEETAAQDSELDLDQSAPEKPRARSSQMLDTRQSMISLHNRRSMANLSNLPPQLRASVFFEHQSIEQKVEIKSQSAVATLDSILAASATAPVSAFTDHPFAGDVRRDVYAREKLEKRHTMASPLVADARNLHLDQGRDLPKDQKRMTMSGLLGRRKSTDMSTLGRRSSVMSALTIGTSDGRKLEKKNSRMSLGSQFTLPLNGEDARLPPDESENVPESERFLDDAVEVPLPEDEAEYRDEDNEQRIEDEGGEQEPFYVQPTTLLAELQLRKAQQKTRTRTAANAFPNGMHSTLLQLDAVAQIEKKKRNAMKVALAWEDPVMQARAEDDADEEVPLGVLYASKIPFAQKRTNEGRGAGELDWDRPLGLIERRQMEDNEPLSSRRMRLQGINPADVARKKAFQVQEAKQARASLLVEEENGQPDEPLTERLRRLKQEAVLDGAVNGGNSSFTEDILGTIGGMDNKEVEPVAEPAAAVETEDETLGQRRARLQRERNQGRNVSDSVATKEPARPNLHSSNSLANLLTQYPTGPIMDKRNAHVPVEGTLLHSTQQYQEDSKRKLREQNARSTSYGRPQVQHSQTYASLPAAGNGGLPTSTSMPLGMLGQNGYFAGASQMQYPQMQTGYANPQQMINPLAYQQFAGHPYNNPAGYPMQMGMPYGQMTPMGVNMGNGMGMSYSGMPAGYPAGYPMPMATGMQNPNIEQNQRSNIDRWRSSIAQ